MKKFFFLAAALVAVVTGRAADSGDMLSSAVVVSNATATVSSPTVVTIPYKGSSLTIMPVFSAETTSTTSNVTFYVNIGDGTTWTTTRPLSYSLSSNGTNTVVGWTTFDKTNFVNSVMKLKLTHISTTQTNNVTISAVNYFTGPP